jgi:hypothetical protein
LRQSDALSTTLFNIVLKKVKRTIETHLNGTLFNKTRQYTAYVDDVLTAGQMVRVTEEVVIQIKEATVSNGLVINKNKTHENKQKYNKLSV